MLTRLKAVAASFSDTVPGRLLRKFGEDQAPNQAVLVAWNTFFAMFPIVLVVLAVLGLVLNLFGVGEDRIQSFVVQLFPGQGQIGDALSSVKKSTGLVFVIGFAGLIWAGTNLFGALERAFDVIFHAKPRDFIHGRLMAIAMIGVFTVLSAVAVGSAAVLPLLGRVPGIPSFLTSSLVFVLQPVVGVGSGFLLFFAIYFVVPNRRLKASAVWPGALFAGIAFEALSLAFPTYVRFTGGSQHYGATFGLLFVILNYFYFVGLITLLGAELNSVLYPIPVEQPGPVAPAGNPLPKPSPDARAAADPEPVGQAADRARAQLSGRLTSTGPGPAAPERPGAPPADCHSPVSGPKRIVLGAVGTILGMLLGGGGKRRAAS